MNDQTYIVCDIETDGLVPGLHSMLQLASVALDSNFEPYANGTFEANISPLLDCKPLDSTMAWWAERPDVYAVVTKDAQDAQAVILRYRAWVESFGGYKVFTGYPVTFDYPFVNYYLWRFTAGTPFSHGALDMKTLAMALTAETYEDSAKRKWPKRWLPAATHAHTALADSVEQAYEFRAMMLELRNK